MRQAKANHFSAVCQDLMVQPSQLWKQLNSLLSRKKEEQQTTQFAEIRRCNTHKECGCCYNKLVSHFSNIPNLSTAAQPPCKLPLALTTFKFSKITVDQVLKMLSKLNVRKATGPNQISARLLRIVAPAIAPSLTSLFNASLLTDQFPSECKKSQYHPSAKSR